MRKINSSSSGAGSGPSFNPQFFKAVFSLELPTPNPAFTHSFLNLIPPISGDPKKIPSMDSESVKTLFHLDYTERFIIISSIEENKSTIILSEANKRFAGIIILQCICSIYFFDCASFDSETSRLYLSIISFLVDIFPGHDDLVSKAFMIVYRRMNRSSHFIEVLPIIMQIAQKVKITNSGFRDPHLKGILTLIDAYKNAIEKKRSAESISKTILAFVKMTKETFECNEEPGIFLKTVDKFFDEVKSINTVAIWSNYKNVSDIQYLHLELLNLCLLIERTTNKPFTKFADIVRTAITINTINLPDSERTFPQTSTTSTLEENDTFDNMEVGVLVKDQREKIESYSFNVPATLSIQGYTEKIQHPVFYFFDALTTGGEIESALQKLIYERLPIESSNYRILLDILISKAPIQTSKLEKIIIQNNACDIFFSNSLFTPDITFFSYYSLAPEDMQKANVLLAARESEINALYRIIIESKNEEFIIEFITFLNKIIMFPAFFTEFAYYSQKVLSCILENQKFYSSLLNTLTKELLVQQKAVFNEEKDAQLIRSFFLHLFATIITSVRTMDPIVVCCLQIYETLLTMLFESSVSSSIAAILKIFIANLLRKFTPGCANFLFQPYINKLLESAAFIESNSTPCIELLEILWESLTVNQPTQQSVQLMLCKNGFIEAILPIIFEPGLDRNIISLVLRIQSLTTIHGGGKDSADYESIAKIINTVGMNKEIYDAVISIISGSQNGFTGIENEAAIPLIASIFESGFCIDFLHDIDNLIKDSIPARYECFQAGLLPNLIRIADSMNDEETIDLCFSIFEKIANVVSDKRTFIEFTKQMRAKPGNKQSKLLPHLYKYLLLMSASASSEERDAVMKFSKTYGEIILPDIDFTSTQLNNTIGISIWIRVSGFRKGSFINLFNFSNKKGKFLTCDMYNDKLKLSSSMFTEDIELHNALKQNEWIKLLIEVKSNCHNIVLYEDGEKQDEQSIKQRSLATEAFDDCRLFINRGDIEIRGQFKQFGIISNVQATVSSGTSIASVQDNSKSSILSHSLLSYKEMSELYDKYDGVKMLFSTTNMIGSKLMNIADSSYATIVNGYVFRYVIPFARIFIRENGLDYVIHSISQIDFPFENGGINKRFAMDVADTIFCLLSSSDSIHKRMIEIDGFAVLAHFMSTSCQLQLDEMYWMKISQIGHALKDPILLSSFYTNVALNFFIWRNGDSPTLIQVFSYWKTAARNKPDVFCSALPTVRIVSVIDYLYENKRLDLENAAILADVLIIVASRKCCVNEVDLILDLIRRIGTIENMKDLFFKAIGNNLKQDQLVFMQFANRIADSEWIAELCDIKLLRSIADTFAWAQSDLFTTFFVFQMKVSEKRKLSGLIEQNDEFVKEFCNLLVSKTGLSIEELTANTKERILNPDVFPFVLSIGFFCSDECMKLVIKFIISILESSESCLILNANIKPFSILQLCILTILHREELFDPFSVFLTTSPNNLRIAFGVFDVVQNSMNSSLESFILNFLERTITYVFTTPGVIDKDKFLDVFIDQICFTPVQTGTLDDEMEENPLNIINFLRMSVPPKYMFNFTLDYESQWMNRSSVLLLSDLITKNEVFNLDRFIVPFSFLLSPTIGFVKRVSILLDSMLTHSKKSVNIWAPVLYQLAKVQTQQGIFIHDAPIFMKQFSSKIKLCADLFLLSNAAIEQFISTAHTAEKDVTTLIMHLSRRESMHLKNRAVIDEISAASKKMDLSFTQKLNDAWNSLKKLLTPFEFSTKFVTGDRYDFHFRNQVLNPFEDETEAGVRSKKVIVSSNNALWRADAYKLLPGGEKEEGTFITRQDAVIFLGKNSPNYLIHSYLIKYIFYGSSSRSIQIFSEDGSLYAFQFIDTEISTIIQQIKMSDVGRAHFIQDDSVANETTRLCAVEKWQQRKVSSFDFLMLVNLLNGRCFNDPNRYPIFPNLLYTSEERSGIIYVNPVSFLSNIHPYKGKVSTKFQKLEDAKASDSLPPEFYYSLEVYEGIELPKTPFDIIKELNKKLETEDWKEWFETHFATLDPLPKRVPLKSFSFSPIEKLIELPSSPVKMSLTNGHLFAVLSNSSFYASNLRHSLLVDPLLPSDPKRIAFIGTPGFSLLDAKSSMKAKPHSIVFSPDWSSDIYVFDGVLHNMPFTSPHISSISCIAASDPYIVSCGGSGDMLVSLYTLSNGLLSQTSTLCIHKEAILCLSVSSSLGLVATASSEGELIVSRIPDLYPLKHFTADGTPKFLKFTPLNHYLVFVYEFCGATCVRVTTANLVLINSTKVTSKIKAIDVSSIGQKEVIIVQTEKIKDEKDCVVVEEIHAIDVLTMEDAIDPLIIKDFPDIRYGTVSLNPPSLVLSSGNSIYSSSIH